jgi:ribosomal protein S18 acetylase RimI-like enzyme
LVVSRAQPALARAQATWIAAMEPWRGLGYRASTLGTWLGRMAREQQVWAVRETSRGPVAGLAVVQDGFLLGAFVALLAVQPAVAGRGLGQALMAQVGGDVLGRRRWLYVSCDRGNRGARRFYRRLGFRQVGVLPDLVRDGRTEILLRKGR